MNRALLPLGMLLLGAADLMAEAKTSGDWTYTVNESGEAVVTAYKGAGGEVVVPAKLDGIPVRHIGDSLFADAGAPEGSDETPPPRVTGVAFPEGLATIGPAAFFHGEGLTNIVIPDSVTSIGHAAFVNCVNVTNLTLGSGLQSIGEGAFVGLKKLGNVSLPAALTNNVAGVFASCTALTNIAVSADNPAFSSVDGVLFDKAGKALLQFTPGRAGDFTVPDGVAEIAKDAFSSAAALTAVTIPPSVTNWPAAGSFSGCSALTNIAVSADNPAFSSVDGVLFDKEGKTLLQFPPGRAGEYTVPEGVTSMADEAFFGAAGLSGVVLPAGLNAIGRSAFGDCTALTNIAIPESVTSIGQWAFIRAAGLTEVEIPAGVKDMGKWVFNDCTALTDITVSPENASFSSNDGVLFDKEGKTLLQFPAGKKGSYVVPDGVTAIETGAFPESTALDSIAFPPALLGNLDSLELPEQIMAKVKRTEDAAPAPAKAIASLKVGDVTYENASLKREFPQSFFIKHDGGLSFVERGDLSEEQVAGLLGTAKE